MVGYYRSGGIVQEWWDSTGMVGYYRSGGIVQEWWHSV